VATVDAPSMDPKTAIPIQLQSSSELASGTSIDQQGTSRSRDVVDRRTSIDTSVIQPGGMRVLLVEDNEINMKLLVAYMRKLKLNHTTAINGLEALNAYKEAQGAFDVIFMGMWPFLLSDRNFFFAIAFGSYPLLLLKPLRQLYRNSYTPHCSVVFTLDASQ
jgi:hypothetical protein